MHLINARYIQMHRRDKYSQHSSINWLIWLNGLSVRLQTKWLWVRIPLLSFKREISHLFRTSSSLAFRQLWSVDSLWNAYVTWIYLFLNILGWKNENYILPMVQKSIFWFTFTFFAKLFRVHQRQVLHKELLKQFSFTMSDSYQ